MLKQRQWREFSWGLMGSKQTKGKNKIQKTKTKNYKTNEGKKYGKIKVSHPTTCHKIHWTGRGDGERHRGAVTCSTAGHKIQKKKKNEDTRQLKATEITKEEVGK